MGKGGESRRHATLWLFVLSQCEPGTYSSCRDASGVRRIVYVAKSQVFGSSTPPPPPSGGAGARVLDLSAPFSISEPGLYVLDRDWDAGGLALAFRDSS